MTIKRILLPICDATGLEPIAKAAFVVGGLLSAQIRALFAQQLSFTLPASDNTTPPERKQRMLEEDHRTRMGKITSARQLFEACALRHPHVEAQFASTEGDVVDVVAHAARVADISILGSGASSAANGWENIRDGALFLSGRPVLLVPPGGVEERHFDRVVIAWKDRIEAARAIAAAHPFLLLAKEVHLVTIGEDAAPAALEDVEQYLLLHRSEVGSESIPASGKSVGDILIDRAEAQGGALLVMGAYSRWPSLEQMFGGVTEHVLREARTPVLMAH